MSKTVEIILLILELQDYRFLVNARKEPQIQTTTYIQVFQEKYGFINNLSILDLLFNEGPNALTYLKNHPITF